MKIIKNIVLLLIAVITTNTIQAQEFSIYASGGLQGKKYTPKQGNLKSLLRGNIGVGYTYYINDNWGILSGLEMGLYANKLSLDNYNYSNYIVDKLSSTFEYRLKADTYHENSSFMSLNVPLMVQYRTNGKMPFYVNVGAKLFLPMKEATENKATNIIKSGYYPDFNLLLDNDPINGFGTIEKLATESTNKLEKSVALSTEIGTFFTVGKNSKLYTGFYLDYGITPIQKKETANSNINEPISTYDGTGLDNSKLNPAFGSFSKEKSTNVLAFGVQLRYAFEFAKAKKKPVEKQPKEKIIPKKKEPIVKKKTEEKVIVEKKEPVKEKPVEKVVVEKKAEALKAISELVLYEFNKYELTYSNKDKLNKIVEYLKVTKDVTIYIESHTDSRGTKQYNMELSKKRVMLIYNYLVDKGVSTNRITYKYFGESKLLNKCKDGVPCSEEEHKVNRRTILEIKE